MEKREDPKQTGYKEEEEPNSLRAIHSFQEIWANNYKQSYRLLFDYRKILKSLDYHGLYDIEGQRDEQIFQRREKFFYLFMSFFGKILHQWIRSNPQQSSLSKDFYIFIDMVRRLEKLNTLEDFYKLPQDFCKTLCICASSIAEDLRSLAISHMDMDPEYGKIAFLQSCDPFIQSIQVAFTRMLDVLINHHMEPNMFLVHRKGMKKREKSPHILTLREKENIINKAMLKPDGLLDSLENKLEDLNYSVIRFLDFVDNYDKRTLEYGNVRKGKTLRSFPTL